jgi:hypothetical protein
LLILFREIITVYSENQTKLTETDLHQNMNGEDDFVLSKSRRSVIRNLKEGEEAFAEDKARASTRPLSASGYYKGLS